MATRDSEVGEGRGQGGATQSGHPFAVFALLVAILALILSLGFALAPWLAPPPDVRPLAAAGRGTPAGPGVGPRPTAAGAQAGAARCAGPGCGAPTATARGATPASVTPVAVEPSPVAVAIPASPSPQTVRVPAALAGDPAVAEVVRAYLRAFDVRAAAFASADPARLATVLGEPELGRTVERLSALRAAGRALRFDGGHQLALVALDGDTARLLDDYLERVVEPAGRGGDPAVGVTRVRALVTLRRIGGAWTIVDSAAAPAR